MDFFTNWEEFSIDGASVPFYKVVENGETFIGFDTRSCVPPEPMVNAMFALNLIKDQNTKVVMINHKFPAGLIPKVEPSFNIDRQDLENGAVKLVFSLKDGVKPSEFDTKQICHG